MSSRDARSPWRGAPLAGSPSGARGGRTRAVKPGRPPGKFTQHRRLDRLRGALEAHPAGMSIAEIASFLNVTTRSVRRYLGYLKLSTPIEPVSASPGRENVWRIKPSERARSVPLRRAPAYCLIAGRGVFEPLKGSALFDALDVVHREVLQVASRPARGPAQGEIHGDTRLDERLLQIGYPAISYAGRGEEIDDLFRAVADLHVVQFRYRDGASGAGGAKVSAHPYAVLLDRGAISLVALDVEAREVRAFSFGRIADLSLRVEERFTLPPDVRASDFAHGAFGVAAAAGSPKVRVLVEFDARVADEIRQRKLHSTQKIATAPDGRVRLSVTLPGALLPEVRRWVLGFAEAARVIEPPELVADVARVLAAAAKRYA
ncbi:MAG: helix-turn-helix transcriptional regulator [Polyangiaceae bacterium]